MKEIAYCKAYLWITEIQGFSAVSQFAGSTLCLLRPHGPHFLFPPRKYMPRGMSAVSYTHLDVYKRQYVYKVGIKGGQFSFSTAVNTFNSVINCVLLVAVNFISRKTSETCLLYTSRCV